MIKSFLEWFWNPDVWLPPGIEWKDVEPNEKINYASSDDLWYPVPTALCLIAIRLVLEITILRPIAKKVGLRKSKHAYQTLPDNAELEEVYRKNKGKLTSKELEALAKRTDMTIRQIERWMRKRLIKDKHTTLDKFCESGYRWFGYTMSVVIGFYVLWDKPWFWDLNHCWYGFPHHSVSDGAWYYYVYGAGFYLSLLILQLFDARRKDFWQMFVHHVTTLFLMAFSWICNFHRMGTLILLLHDCADTLLEVGKMCKYAKYDKTADVIFVIFTIFWISTRLGIFPFYIIKSTTIDAPRLLPMYPVYYIFNSMIIVLLLLSTFWTYYILKIAVKAVVSGKVEDARSSSESPSELSDSEENDTSSNRSKATNKR